MLHRLHRGAFLSAIIFSIFASAAGQATPVQIPSEQARVDQGQPHIILAAANDQCTYRCRILREECSQDAASQSRSDDQCWDTYTSCRSVCEGGSTPTNTNNNSGNTNNTSNTGNNNTATVSAPDSVVLNPTVINVGKWAEGVAFDGRWLWVSESGQRTISKIDLSGGGVIDRVKVGRLPVAMVSSGDGNAYALVHTDRLIWRQSAQRGGGVFARLRECPESMITTGRHLWVLTAPSCSSESSRVTRVDVRNGRQVGSGVLGEWGQALTAHSGQIWVAHARAPAISIVDQNTLDAYSIDVPGASFWSIAGGTSYVYAGGRQGDDNQSGLVVMMDPQSQQELYRTHFPERIAEIGSTEAHVVAVGEQGTIWVLSADNLELQRTITLSTGGFEPRAVLVRDDAVIVTSGVFNGERGAVFVLQNWRPSAVQVNVSPGFDCGAARTATEHAICGSNQLSALDAEMTSEFDLAVSNTTSPAVGGTAADVAALRNEQRQWLRGRNRCGSDVSCLEQAYYTRLGHLRELNQPE